MPQDKDTTPPIGLVPKYLHDEKRLWDIFAAMTRYNDANLLIPSEWIKEYEELTRTVGAEREIRSAHSTASTS